ncbi:hypothetical protein LEP3755_30010 [Leptolyngbya sp. NIES-3755]|nr:hypothetical protein LEP3755_30010 [Leptolyngbya sp. NIES-3755]
MSRLFRSIVILSLASSISLPAIAESAPETAPTQTGIAKPEVTSEKPVVVSQTEIAKPQEAPKPVEVTRIPLSSRIFAVPSMEQ